MRGRWILAALALAGTLALSGCSMIGGTSAAAPTDPATVLQRVKSFSASDISIMAQMDGTSAGKKLAGGVSGHITTNPARADLTYSLTLDGQQVSFEVIADTATQTTYTYYTIPAQLHTGLWVKQPMQSGTFENLSGLTSFNLSDLAVVGPDNVEGINVWHLHGTDTSGGTQAQDDIYVSEADLQPVQAIVKTTGSDSGTITVSYTAFNTGVHIDLPPPEHVQSA